jgi:hypothetical protein
VAPIFHFEWDFNLAMDLLDGFLISLPTKAGAKNGMPLENPLPGTKERGSVDVFVQSTKDLTDVESLFLGFETMK